MRKFGSISLDTNVMLDIPARAYLSSKGNLTPEETKMLKRTEDSLHTVIMCLTEQLRLKKVGVRVVEKELSRNPIMLEIYKSIFPFSVKKSADTLQLAELYQRKIGIPAADSLILATVSLESVDVFLTWNKDDITNEKVQREVEKINHGRRIKVPLFITPTFFMERLMLSEDRKTLCISPSPTPPVYRVHFSPSK